MYQRQPKTVYEWLTNFNMYDRIKQDPIMPPKTVQLHYQFILKDPKMIFVPQPWRVWNQLAEIVNNPV